MKYESWSAHGNISNLKASQKISSQITFPKIMESSITHSWVSKTCDVQQNSGLKLVAEKWIVLASESKQPKNGWSVVLSPFSYSITFEPRNTSFQLSNFQDMWLPRTMPKSWISTGLEVLEKSTSATTSSVTREYTTCNRSLLHWFSKLFWLAIDLKLKNKRPGGGI